MIQTPAGDLMDVAHLQLRFFHLHKLAISLRGGVTEADLRLASQRLAGVDAETATTITAEYAAQVRDSAQALLAESRVRSALETVPFEPGATVVALGDSITDDALSWAAHLQAVLDAGRPDLGVTVHNAGFTGDTTQNAIARYDTVHALRPDWVLQLLGTNDIRRHGAARVPMSTPAETARNFAVLRDFVEEQSGARLVSLTPPPIDEAQVVAWAPFGQEAITWRAADAEQVAETLRSAGGDVVDVHAAMSDAGATPLLLPDGLHPSLLGQRFIARTVLLGLAELTA